MTPLAKDLFQRRYDDLVVLGRSRLPAWAPEWTDHNVHDPGITLMELLASRAEAQLYSLARMRRDERAAYAALMGVERGTTVAARGMLWPDDRDALSPWRTFNESQVIGPADAIHVVDETAPLYRATGRVLWVPAAIRRIWLRRRDGSEGDLTAQNRSGGIAYRPFGADARAGDVVAIDIGTRGAGLFPKRRAAAQGARLMLGIRTPSGAAPGGSAPAGPPPFEVELVAGEERFALPVVEDTTAGLLRTGTVALDVSGVAGSPADFRLEIRAPRGFVRPPVWLRVAPSVVPIEQRETVLREPHDVNRDIAFGFALDVPGLVYAPGQPRGVRIDCEDAADALLAWTPCERLEDQGPGDAVYELDEATGRLRFGNGVNGRAPHSGSPMFATYDVSLGAAGNAAPNRRWVVQGFGGAFGVNLDAVAGGRAAPDEVDRRREARERVRSAHALVTAEDLVDAALGQPLLGVARAWVVRDPSRPGSVALVALRQRDGPEDEGTPESPRWLRALRRALAPRVPLGSRLAVTAPRYVDFSVRAVLEIERGRNAAAVADEARKQLTARLALVPQGPGSRLRAPGVPLSAHEVGAWLRAVEGVTAVRGVELVGARGRAAAEIRVPRDGLPRLVSIEARREGGS